MLCQDAGLFGAFGVVAAACLEIHRAETGSISTIMLPVMETKKENCRLYLKAKIKAFWHLHQYSV